MPYSSNTVSPYIVNNPLCTLLRSSDIVSYVCQSNSQSPTYLELTKSDSQSPTDSESTQSQNIGNTWTKFLYVHDMPIWSRLLDVHSILYSNSCTRCKYISVFLRPVNAVLIMLLITYFTIDRVLLSIFVLSYTPVATIIHPTTKVDYTFDLR